MIKIKLLAYLDLDVADIQEKENSQLRKNILFKKSIFKRVPDHDLHFKVEIRPI